MLKICCTRPTGGSGTLMGCMGVELVGRLTLCQGTAGLWFDWYRERVERVLHEQVTC